MLVALFVWWLPEIGRLFCPNKCKCEEKTEHPEPTKNNSNEIISRQDIERFITSAIMIGIQKFAAAHPKTQQTFDNILDVIKNTKTKSKRKK